MSVPEKKHYIKITIIDDHSLIRHAFKSYLDKYEDLEVVIQVDDGNKLFKELRNKLTKIDVAIFDLFSPGMDGREALKMISQLYPAIHPIILSACTDQKIINDIFSLGALAFISKTSEPDELYEAIISAANGIIYQNKYYIPNQNLIFSPIEIEVLELIWIEKTNEEIARILCISLSAIEKIKHQLKEKTGTKSTIGLLKYAIERRILNLG